MTEVINEVINYVFR